MIEKYLRKNKWIKSDGFWFDTTGKCLHRCHRHAAVMVQLLRDRTLFYYFIKLFKNKKNKILREIGELND